MGERIPIPVEMTGYARVHVPDDVPDGPAPALIAVHGYGMPPEDMADYAKAVAPGAVIVAPEGPSAWYRRPSTKGGARLGGVGYGWIADPDRDAAEARNCALIGKALDLAAERHAIDPARTFALGFSQGAAVATYFAVENPELVAGVIGLAGGAPQSWRPRLSALADHPVLWVTGTHDASYPPAYIAELLAAFEAGGVDAESVVLDEAHGLMPAAQPVVTDWLRRRLATS